MNKLPEESRISHNSHQASTVDVGTIAELLWECADAIELAVVDGSHRDTHYARIAELMASTDTSPQLVELLRCAEEKMRIVSTLSPLDFISIDGRQDNSIAIALRSFADPVHSHLYHGTVFGRLPSIVKDGLVPAMKPVWTANRYVKESVQEYCKHAVFFTTSWRAAVTWAEAAHRRSRGPRDSLSRTPVIVRIPGDGLAIEPDRVAVAPKCVLVRGSVPAANAEVFVAPLQGFPTWTSLDSLVASRAPAAHRARE